MKIQFLLFLSSSKAQLGEHFLMRKTIESNIRPVKGDILDDPGFDSGFHNGYEVVKVTINYVTYECLVSLSPLAIELEEIPIATYIKKLEANGWKEVSNELR